MSTVKDAAEYRKSLNFLGAFVPCKSSTKIPVCPSVYPSAGGKKIADPLNEFSQNCTFERCTKTIRTISTFARARVCV